MCKIRKHISKIFTALGMIAFFYITFWVMIINPISKCVLSLNAGTATTGQIIITILSCIFSGTFGICVYAVFRTAGVILQTAIEKRQKNEKLKITTQN